MKKLYLTLSILCLLFTAHAQDLHVEWTRFIGGTSYDEASDAIETSDKGIVFTGYTNSADGDIPLNTPDTATNTNKSNLVIGKLDSNRQLSWVKVYGGSHADYGVKVKETSDGFIILAYTESNDGDVTNYHDLGDVWLLKTDKLGNLQWERAYGSPYSDWPMSIAQTHDGGYIVLATSAGAGGDVPIHYSNNSFYFDWFVFKTDSVGQIEWAKTLGGNSDEYQAGCILEANNGYYLVGGSRSRDHDCTDTSWHSVMETHYDSYLLHLDTVGNVLWNKSYGGSGGDVIYDAVWEESDSSLIMAASTTSNDYMIHNNHGSYDVWVFKTDQDGNLKWERTLGDAYWDEPRNIIKDADGGFMVSGKAGSTAPIPPGHYSTSSNMWLFKLDSTGSVITQKIIGGTQTDWPSAVTHFQNGYAAVGSTNALSFVEGISTTHHGPMDDFFISVIDYFPVSVKQRVPLTPSLKVYPNPSGGRATIVLPEKHKNGTLILTDVNGKQVYRQRISSDVDNVEISDKDIIAGTYLVRWKTVEGELSGKLIKK